MSKRNFIRFETAKPKCKICGRSVDEIRLVPTIIKTGSGWCYEVICIECLYRLMKARNDD